MKEIGNYWIMMSRDIRTWINIIKRSIIKLNSIRKERSIVLAIKRCMG